MTEHPGGSDRPSRNWKIPTRIYGRVRTSTVLIGICFILTALLYDQVRPEPESAVNGPVAVDTSQYQTDQQTYQQQYTTTVPRSTTVAPSTTDDPTESGGTSAEPGSSSGEPGTSATQDPTFLPGLTVPPELRSLFPQTPSAPARSGTP